MSDSTTRESDNSTKGVVKSIATAKTTSTDTSAKTTSGKEELNINEYCKGIAYVNEVMQNDTTQKFSVKISAMQGGANKMRYKYRRLTVSSGIALELLLKHKDEIDNEECKVIIHYTMANPDVYPYIINRGDDAGKAAAIMTGFLTRIRRLKIDGKTIYEDERFNEADHLVSTEM